MGPPLPHRAGLRTAKPSGEWTCPSRGYGPQHAKQCTAHLRPIVKRSFHRACKRALEHGETAYRGRTLKPQHLSQEQIQKARATISRKGRPSQTSQAQQRPRTGRHSVLVWNSGGLAYQDFLYWLTLQEAPPEIVIVVETRLAHHMEHATEAYFLMHSAQQHAGILIMIHKSVAPLHRITWRVIEPGRVVHVRVYGTRGHLNIIGYYQQAWQPQSPGACLQERCRIQAMLEHVLTECSTRHLMLLGGDFNTDLVPMTPYVGTALPPTASQAKHRQPDGPALQDLIRRQGLCVLNTFHGWQPTFQGAGPRGDAVSSRIDFLMVRRPHADDASRQCKYYHDFILTAHLTTKPHWTPWQRQTTSLGFSADDRHKLVQAYRQCPTQWAQWQAQATQAAVAAPNLEAAMQSLQASTKQQLERVQPAPAARVTKIHNGVRV